MAVDKFQVRLSENFQLISMGMFGNFHSLVTVLQEAGSKNC